MELFLFQFLQELLHFFFLFQNGFDYVYYSIAQDVNGLIFSRLSVQWAISRTGQKKLPSRRLICLYLLIYLDFLGPFPQKFKRHDEFLERTL